MTEGPPRLLVLGLPRDAKLGAVEELLSGRCTQRVVRIDMGVEHAIVDLEAESDVASCVGRHDLLGRVIVVLRLNREMESEINAQGGIPPVLAQQVAMLQPPELPPPTSAPVQGHQRGHSDSRLLQIGTKRLRPEPTPMLPTPMERSFPPGQGSDLTSSSPTQAPGAPAAPGTAAVMAALDLPLPVFPNNVMLPVPGAAMASYGGQAPLLPGFPAISPQQLLLAMQGTDSSGTPLPIDPQLAASIQRRQQLMAGPGPNRKVRHNRAHSDNAVLAAYDPSRVLAPGVGDGRVPGRANAVDDSVGRPLTSSQRRTRVGLSYKCGKCGQPKRGHICRGAPSGLQGVAPAAADDGGATTAEAPKSRPAAGDKETLAMAAGAAVNNAACQELIRQSLAMQVKAQEAQARARAQAQAQARMMSSGMVPILPQSRSLPEAAQWKAMVGKSLGSETAWAQHAANQTLERPQAASALAADVSEGPEEASAQVHTISVRRPVRGRRKRPGAG